MHYVDRGPEPEGLKPFRDRYTPRWVAFYRNGEGTRPSDSHWRDFSWLLASAFHGLCAYCEDRDKGEVDHFRPKSRFPELVYGWTNWVFSCHSCNRAKGEAWPDVGYVDPCDASEDQRPERFFDFDAETGEILPRRGLIRAEVDRAWQMIHDLDLNGWHHWRSRLEWVTFLRNALSAMDSESPSRIELVRAAASRDTRFSSVARAVFTHLGYSWQEAE